MKGKEFSKKEIKEFTKNINKLQIKGHKPEKFNFPIIITGKRKIIYKVQRLSRKGVHYKSMVVEMLYIHENG